MFYDIILSGGFMLKYNHEEYLKHEIMGQNRHQFIYGYDGIQRKRFLESMANCYPVVLDKESPMAIYVTDFGLPKISVVKGEHDKTKIALISSEFLYFSIASDILLKAKVANDVGMLNERIKKLIEILNKCSINRDYPPIADFDDLIKVLIQSKEFYKKYYMEYYGEEIEAASINEIPLPFMQFDMFIRYLKRAINNDSYFGIIIDKQKDIALSSTKAINGLVGSRINKDISIKIAVEPNKWDSYIDSNGQLIEYVHDYGTVELDDLQSQYLKKFKRNI